MSSPRRALGSPNSVAKSVGRREGLRIMVRDVFLDNEADETHIKAQLLKLEKISRRRGYAIAPYDPSSKEQKGRDSWNLQNCRASCHLAAPQQ